MTWGFSYPYGHGDYMPQSGAFPEYQDKLDHYFDTALNDEERASFDNRKARFRYASTKKFKDDLGYVEEYERPVDYVIRKTYRNLADMLLVMHGLLVVEERVKDIIETLEPNVHQFWPITVTLPNGPIEKQYYGFVIRRHLDAFVPEQTDPDALSGPLSPGINAAWGTKKAFGGVALDKATIKGAHIWRDVRLKRPDFYMSDTLNDAFEAANVRLFKHYKVRDAQRVTRH